jgi:hypothetical protein
LGALVFEVTRAGVANGTARDGEMEEELDVLLLDQENINYPFISYFLFKILIVLEKSEEFFYHLA